VYSKEGILSSLKKALANFCGILTGQDLRVFQFEERFMADQEKFLPFLLSCLRRDFEPLHCRISSWGKIFIGGIIIRNYGGL